MELDSNQIYDDTLHEVRMNYRTEEMDFDKVNYSSTCLPKTNYTPNSHNHFDTTKVNIKVLNKKFHELQKVPSPSYLIR